MASVIGRLYRHDFIRFCIVGGITAGIQLGLYSVLLHANVYYELSSAMSMVVSTLLAYLGNRIWTFHSSRQWWMELLEYAATRAATIALNEVILYGLVEYVRFGKFTSQVIAVVAITIVNYVIGKLIVFRKNIVHEEALLHSGEVASGLTIDRESL